MDSEPGEADSHTPQASPILILASPLYALAVSYSWAQTDETKRFQFPRLENIPDDNSSIFIKKYIDDYYKREKIFEHAHHPYTSALFSQAQKLSQSGENYRLQYTKGENLLCYISPTRT